MGERIQRRLVYWASYWEERSQGLLFGKSGKGVFIKGRAAWCHVYKGTVRKDQELEGDT